MIVAVLVLSCMLYSVGEARPLKDGSALNHSHVHGSMKKKLLFWIQSLAAGPSSGGAGH